MKKEQGVRDSVDAGVVHGRATLDRRCISFNVYVCRSQYSSVLSRARHFSTLLNSSPAQSVIRRKETFEQTFLPVDYMYMLQCSIQMTMRKIPERREVSSLYSYPNYRPSSLRSGSLTLPFPLNTPHLRINKKPNSISLFPFLGASH